MRLYSFKAKNNEIKCKSSNIVTVFKLLLRYAQVMLSRALTFMLYKIIHDVVILEVKKEYTKDLFFSSEPSKLAYIKLCDKLEGGKIYIFVSF